ncbi:MAG: hypothetical protein N3F65_02570 [Nitrososphaeria archaeon]|nr:hypothetical protein [Aigarchaeota archaeon]MCX8187478.1 hypothetical protein [Nitrososphaeria archaeon]MDW8021482.1 hypothetical protein [Nitrososphaerota archaeon]
MELARQPKNATKLLDEFSDIVGKLADESRHGIPIIVEGKRDEEALRRLGINGEIILMKSIRGLRRRLENRNLRRIILLLDLDNEGERLLKLLKKSLEGVVREIDVTYWKKLRVIKKMGFTEIESMHLFLRKLQHHLHDLPP